MKFCFGDIVVVESNLIGVVVKSWINPKSLSLNSKDREVRHEVYVRYFNEIREYPEELMERYMVRHKYLEGEEIIWQSNAVNNTIDAIDTPLTDNEKEIFQKIMQGGFFKEEQLEEREGWDTSISLIVYSSKPEDKALVNRAYNAFTRAKINTLKDFFNKEPYQIMRIRNIGKKSLNAMVRIIYEYCISHNIDRKYDITSYNI